MGDGNGFGVSGGSGGVHDVGQVVRSWLRAVPVAVRGDGLDPGLGAMVRDLAGVEDQYSDTRVGQCWGGGGVSDQQLGSGVAENVGAALAGITPVSGNVGAVGVSVISNWGAASLRM
ncbi:hypothetical protein DAVIS_03289 [Mycobacterium marinum]|uniref:Uncharacterized protein n=1 Tax=Mycobacterium marinum TaxID=1781 RepID=A0A3E2MU31_MYCMR|nr:hypothetical protein DAVIS_03289 [Mycobacterium marinum]